MNCRRCQAANREGRRFCGECGAALAVICPSCGFENEASEKYLAELYRLKGTLVARAGASHENPAADREAETWLHKAVDVARSQNAKSLELRAMISLSRLRRQGKKEEARTGLAHVYEWFTEGLDTRDLREAKGFLESLS